MVATSRLLKKAILVKGGFLFDNFSDESNLKKDQPFSILEANMQWYEDATGYNDRDFEKEAPTSLEPEENIQTQEPANDQVSCVQADGA